MSLGSTDISSAFGFAQPGTSRGPAIHIKLSDHYNAKVYTSGSTIAGEVVINTVRDISFACVSTGLLGIARSRVELAQIPRHASHIFLNLRMPIPKAKYPTPRIFRGDNTYRIPFSFTVPQHLSLSACQHQCESNAVLDQHIRPPPSVGYWERDDLSPDMARIEYIIVARVEAESVKIPIPVLMETTLRVNVLPTSVEDPPLNISTDNRGYALTRSTNIRRSLFASKRGRITASAAQPSAIRMRPDGRGASDITITVNVRFEPTSCQDAPPNINQASAKIEAFTWFTGAPAGNLPNLGDLAVSFGSPSHMNYSTSVPVILTSLTKDAWTTKTAAANPITAQHQPAPSIRRQSDSLLGSNTLRDLQTPRRGSEASTGAYHESTTWISLQVPTSRLQLLPTFHICLISRTYTLHLVLYIGSSKLNLSIPVQIIVDSLRENLQPDSSLPSFENVLQAQEETYANDAPGTSEIRNLDSATSQGGTLPNYSWR
ncbi:Fc.00g116210.m01.CDS01 [Cosmosporella sp. VM-42]